MKSFWTFVSRIGVDQIQADENLVRKTIFFNRAIVIGFFGTIFQCINVWPFMGYKALSFGLVCAAIIVALYLNKKGEFQRSKNVLFYTVYAVGCHSILILGGDTLFHLGSFTTFTFGLLIFDYRKDKLLIAVSVVYILFTQFAGEHGFLFNAPEFSSFQGIETIRFFNILSMVIINSVFVLFMLKLNRQNEQSLERQVAERTLEIEQQKNALAHQNEEKVILLQEIHHRVKNNLQIIVSLINLQLNNSTNEEARIVLTDINNRVQSMSIVHERMYKTTDFKNISIASYTAQLIDNFNRLYGCKKCTFETEIPNDFNLNIEYSIPIGLILNELISNFFKYGKDKEGQNRCTISVQKNEAGIVTFEVRDNGIGYPEEMNLSNTSTLGLTLIRSLVNQIEGDVKFFNDKGAVCQFTFQL